MTLREFILMHPHEDRRDLKIRLGKACGVTEIAIRGWYGGHRSPAAKRVRALCAATGGMVTPGEVLPEVFGYTQK